MKRLTVLPTLFLLVMLIGCGKNSPSSMQDNVSGIPLAKPLTTPLDKEAAELAIQIWKPTKIGESYYLHMVETGRQGGCSPSDEGKVLQRTIYELRKVSVVILGGPVSEAQRLNGIEWYGSVALAYKTIRVYRPQKFGTFAGSSDKGWSEWVDRNPASAGPLISFGGGSLPVLDEPTTIGFITKVKGKWGAPMPSTVLGNKVNVSFEQVEASDLPK
jgi:hypothetical protein